MPANRAAATNSAGMSFEDSAAETIKRLLQAASTGDRATVTEIIDAKCDVNVRDVEGWSPLILASKVTYSTYPSVHKHMLTLSLTQVGDMGMVEYLLERGASPNPAAVAHTAIRAASIFGHEKVTFKYQSRILL